MAAPTKTNIYMRTIHRYLGFFLAGIMAVYALSGILLIFRDTDFLKQEQTITETVKTNATGEELGELLQMRKLKVLEDNETTIIFENGAYNKQSGQAVFTIKELPLVLDKLTHLHKARSGDPLFFLNVFFGLSLLFFVVSAFWMYLPGTDIFKKGMYYTLGGIILTLVLLFV